jgi:hypothetical protein
MKTDDGKTLISMIELCKYGNMNKREAKSFLSVFKNKVQVFSKMTKTIRGNKYGKHTAIVDMIYFVLEDAIDYCKKESDRANINKSRKKNLSKLIYIKNNIED